MAQARLSLEEFVESQPLSRSQVLIGVLCFLAVLLDGFDSILIGYIAPAIKAEWGLTPPQLAPCRVLAVAFGVGVLALLALGHAGTAAIVLLPLMFAMGVGTGGAQTGGHVVTSSFYRTSIRATGMSWALGIGRIGSVVGSMAGGYLLGLHWTASEMLTLMAAVLLVATLGAALLTPLMRHAALASASNDASGREHAALAAGPARID